MSRPRLALRAEYERGAMEKHAYAREMAVLHAVLLEYASLVVETDIAAVHIRDGLVIMESRHDGVLFPCDPQDRGIPPVVALNFRGYERQDFAMIRRLVPPGATVVDVGANIGWYALHIAAAAPGATVFAFEPVPSSFAWLQKAVALNAASNVHCLSQAVGAMPGEIVLYVDSSIAGAASAAPSGGVEGAEPIRCPMTSLDAFAVERGVTIDFLKLDIEGGELAALQGAAHVLATQRPIVFAEMLRKLARPFGYHPNDIIALMRQHGYRCFHVSGERLRRFTTMDESTTETNFYFLHADAHSAAIARLGMEEEPAPLRD